jgi:hypothetical protein
MVTSFALLTLIAILSARYKSYRNNWLTIHTTVQFTAILIATIGLSSAFFMVENVLQHNHFSTIHSIIGLTVVLIQAIVIPTLGFQSPRFQFESKLIHQYQITSIRYHRLLGYSIYFLSLFNIVLGILLINGSNLLL